VSYLEPELIAEKPTSVGKAIPGTETMVLDAEGRSVAPGETGVLYVRGPHVMVGYWRQPEQSAHMLKDGTSCADRDG
jgi:long-chain acyl-CoA synthetase